MELKEHNNFESVHARIDPIGSCTLHLNLFLNKVAHVQVDQLKGYTSLETVNYIMSNLLF